MFLASGVHHRQAVWAGVSGRGSTAASNDNDFWYRLSDEPTDGITLAEDDVWFDIEENFLDDKANGLQLESSLMRSAQALPRLCFVAASTTLSLGVVRHRSGAARQPPPRRPPLVSGSELLEDWLELGEVGPEQRARPPHYLTRVE